MQELKFLTGYNDNLIDQVHRLINENRLDKYILERYPAAHDIKTDKDLYVFTMAIKNQFLRNSHPLSRIAYDSRISPVEHVLGMHYFIARVQGTKIRSKNEIKIASIFKNSPEEFLRMIVVHELAHLKEKEHNRAFYRLCEYMEPDYYQIEFDMRCYLTYMENHDPLYN